MKHEFFKSYFFPSMIIELNNLDYSLRNAPSINAFNQNILNLIRVDPSRYTMSITQAD